MASGEQELTHDEIWDDSALIESWDQALEEYKKYHSIHKNGGNVNDLLNPKKEESTSNAKKNPHEINEPSNHERLETASEMRDQILNDEEDAKKTPTQHGQSHPSGAPPAPAGLLGSIRDEGLKRLLMSWYYAGYYTGYYEGQRDSSQN